MHHHGRANVMVTLKMVRFVSRCEEAPLQPHLPRGVPAAVVPAAADVPHVPLERAARAGARARHARAAPRCARAAAAAVPQHAAAAQ